MGDETSAEKRAIRRFALQLPVEVTAGSNSSETVMAETRDVSSNGICFYCDAAMKLNSEIEFRVTLPEKVTLTEPIKLQCRGTVLRVEEADGKFAIAAEIHSYDFVASDEDEKSSVADDSTPAL